MFSDALRTQAAELLAACRGKGLTLATAESCTGGLISALLTDIAGSSDVFECGFITYSYESKTRMLGVDAALIKSHGAVSREVAGWMARGAKDRSGASLAVAVTGIAGPGGGTPTKPVGTVFIAVAAGDNLVVEECHFSGNRTDVRAQTAAKALLMLEKNLSSVSSVA